MTGNANALLPLWIPDSQTYESSFENLANLGNPPDRVISRKRSLLVCFESFFILDRPIMAVCVDPVIWKTGVAAHTLAAFVLLVVNAVDAHHHPSNAGHDPFVTTTSIYPSPGKAAHASTNDHDQIQMCPCEGLALQLLDKTTHLLRQYKNFTRILQARGLTFQRYLIPLHQHT